MEEALLTWLPFGATVLVALIAVWALLREKKARLRLESKYDAIETILKNERAKHESMVKQFNELRAGTIGMSKKLAEMSHRMEDMVEKQVEIEMQDPDSRLYSRASKMVDLGADLDELMNECDLPKAEAELLLNLRKRQASAR